MSAVGISYVDAFSIGIIQTTLDSEKAWQSSPTPRISAAEDNRAWHEIRRAIRALANHEEQPRIILLPELALPRTRLDDFERMVCSMNSIAIVGTDYRLDHSNCSAKNEGVVLVPRNFWKSRPSTYGSRVWFGKHVPAPNEAHGLSRYVPPWTFSGDPNVYVFDAGQFGRIGISICYDFMDVERALLYRGRIHHLVVLAYNQDIKMFESLAVSLSRTVFCNVIVCNTGKFGGSLLVAPFYKAHHRLVYGVDGNGLFSAQCVRLQVRELDDAIHGLCSTQIYKHRPPGYIPHF